MKQRVDYQLAVIAYKTRSTGVPAYLSTLIEDYVPSRSLRSSDQLLMCAPCVKLVCSRKAFSVNAPMVWNSLSLSCRSAQSLSSFKRLLKTDLLSAAYINSSSLASDSLVTWGALTIVLYVRKDVVDDGLGVSMGNVGRL